MTGYFYHHFVADCLLLNNLHATPPILDIHLGKGEVLLGRLHSQEPSHLLSVFFRAQSHRCLVFGLPVGGISKQGEGRLAISKALAHRGIALSDGAVIDKVASWTIHDNVFGDVEVFRNVECLASVKHKGLLNLVLVAELGLRAMSV